MPKIKNTRYPSKPKRRRHINLGLLRHRRETFLKRLGNVSQCQEKVNTTGNGSDQTSPSSPDRGACSQTDQNIASNQSSPWSDYVKTPIKSGEKEAYVNVKENNDAKSIDLSGRRIVDIMNIFKNIQNISLHEPLGCTFADMDLVSEQRSGFHSTFTFRCKLCGLLGQVDSENVESPTLDINTAVVTGALCTGQGFAQVEEVAAILNMPSIGKETFCKIQMTVQNAIHDVALSEMKEAGRLEAELAIAAGDVDKNGVPEITVVADGAWAKRSYRTNYNSLSGVASIVGKRTSKVLFIGVRNSYCCICARAKNLQQDAKDHVCSKNWSKSSTAMESDIIVQGFKSSLAMHGIKYTRLIGDGDSSVMASLSIASPYGNGCPIQKIECSNHLLRNYVNKLREITKKRINSKGEVPMFARKAVEKEMPRLRSAIAGAAKHWSNDTSSLLERIEAAKEDFTNSPSHVFGEHKNCKAYFCKGAKTGEVSIVEELRKCGVWDDIHSAVNWLVHNTASLLEGMTNNLCEAYNSSVAKFVGGKRVNFSLRGSYAARCEAAVASFNTEHSLHSLIHKEIVKNSPGFYTKKYIGSMQKSSTKRKARRALYNEKKKKQVKYCGPDEHYGQEAVMLDDGAGDFTDEKMAEESRVFLKNLNKSKAEIEEITKHTIDQNCSALWTSERRIRLTASNFGIVIKRKSTTKNAPLVKNLLYSSFSGNRATRYGIEKEPLARRDAGELLGITIRQCGLIISEEYPFLGASPDGLIDEDGLLEIKCPFNSASLTPEEAIEAKKIKFCNLDEEGKISLKRTHNYWFQVQGQLQVSKRQFCIFVIWTPKGISSCRVERDDKGWAEHLPKLQTFYMKHMLPELINPRIPRGLPIREVN